MKAEQQFVPMTAEEIAQWVINNRYPKNEQEKVSDAEMYQQLLSMIKELKGGKKRERLNLPCRFSGEYINSTKEKYWPRLRQKRGVLLYQAKDGCYVVLWNSARYPQRYHKDFIEIVAED